ncbi:MAG: YceI family protein [Blastocatellia bacterium]
MKHSHPKALILFLVVAVLSLFAPQASRSFARTTTPVVPTPANSAAAATYRIDAGQSRFMVKAYAGGFLSALAHDHNIAIREFNGEAQFTFGTVEPASLQLKIKASSLAVTDKVSASDRQKIEATMRDEVLEVGKYPEIVFISSKVSAAKTGEGQYQTRIAGELTLHGVTRPLTITTQLEFGDSVLRARGGFSLKQSIFDIKPVSVAGGTIKVKDELKFTFEIVAKP